MGELLTTEPIAPTPAGGRYGALALPAVTTMGLVLLFDWLTGRILPALDGLAGDGYQLVLGGSITLTGLATIIAQSTIVVALLLLFVGRRKDASAQPVFLGSVFNVVNAMLGTSVALCTVAMMRVDQVALRPVAELRGRVLTASWPRGSSMSDRCDVMTKIVVHRIKANEMRSSENYGRELYAMLPQCEKVYRDYGYAVVTANIVLGHFALHRGAINGAKRYLAAAGDAPPSPSLAAVGPGMSLAHELLVAGQRRAVLDYFAKSRRLWPKGASRLDHWSQQVTSGVPPRLLFFGDD